MAKLGNNFKVLLLILSAYVDLRSFNILSINSFEIFGIEVKATLAVDGKYMMIYTDKNLKESDTTSDAYKNREKAIEKFEAFSPKK